MKLSNGLVRSCSRYVRRFVELKYTQDIQEYRTRHWHYLTSRSVYESLDSVLDKYCGIVLVF